MKPLWPRSHVQPPPLGYELCSCDGCENKTWDGHILNEDDDDETSPYGNLHLEYIQYDSDDEENDDDNYIEMSESTASSPYPAVASESYDFEC